MKTQASRQLTLPPAFVQAFFRRWENTVECDGRWLSELNQLSDTIRQEVVHGAADSNRLQCQFNSLTAFIPPACGAALRAALAGLPTPERLPALMALVGFSLLKPDRDLITLLGSIPPELARLQLWTHRQLLQRLEARLGIQGCLVDAHPPAETWLELKPTYADPALAFGLEVGKGRRRLGLTQREVAALTGWNRQDLQAFEKGRRVPGWESLEKVLRLAVVLGGPAVLDGFYVARAHKDRLYPAAPRKDLLYAERLTPEHHRQINHVLAWDNLRTGVTRGGRRYSGGKLEDSSQKVYRYYFAMWLTYAQLPSHADNPRQSGLGLAAAEVSILDLGHLPFLRGLLAWFRARNGRSTPAKSEAALLGKLRSYFDPRDGYFYAHAEQLALSLPSASLARCPTVWPQKSDSPGTPCRNDAEKIRARCHEIYALIQPLLAETHNAPPSPERLKDITQARAQFWHLLDALLMVLVGIPHRVPRTVAEALASQACAIFALACWHPLRIGEYTDLHLEDVILLADGRLEVRIHPWKNRGSRLAREQVHQLMPPELAERLRDYLRFARPLLAPTGGSPWLFLNPDGRKITEYRIRRDQQLLLAQYGEDIFPVGLSIHRRRSLVATDCVTRFGWTAGLLLAARALVDAESTVAEHYVLREPDPARLQPGEPSQAAAIAAAYRAVTGDSFRPTPLKPR